MNDQIKAEQPNEAHISPSALNAGLDTITHFWCEVCREIQPVIVESMNHFDVTASFRGGDIVCKKCNFVITTAYVSNVEVSRPR